MGDRRRLSSRAARALEVRGYLAGALGERVKAGVLALRRRTFDRTERDERSLTLFGGVAFGPSFALEASRVSLGRQRLAEVLDFGFDVDVDGTGLAAGGLWRLGRLTLFAKAGTFWWKEEGRILSLIGPLPYSEDGRDRLLCAGLEIEAVRHLRFRGEWERYRFDSEEVDDLWVGVVLRRRQGPLPQLRPSIGASVLWPCEEPRGRSLRIFPRNESSVPSL